MTRSADDGEEVAVDECRPQRPGIRIARQVHADGDGTLVTTTASMLGDIDDELRESYTTGGAQLLQALKAHAESKVA